MLFDLDSTVLTLYRHQEKARIGYHSQTGPALTPEEENLMIAQARLIGNL